MACDTYIQLAAEERARMEAEREADLARLEADIACGIAQVVVLADGTVTIQGVLPAGMQDACVLAALERRNSQAFTDACTTAGVHIGHFAHAHGHSH